MGFRVTTNIAAINAQKNLVGTQRQVGKAANQLASGSRINVAADDAAGLAISENIKAQIRSARQATRNANDGISMVQTAEGGLQELSNIVVRLRELGIQAASDTVGSKETIFIDYEAQQLLKEMDRIARVTTYGSTKLLDGSAGVLDFQVGLYNNAQEDRISFDSEASKISLETLGLESLSLADKLGAQDGLGLLDSAQTQINGLRANLGALQNRLTSTVDNLGVAEENMSAANSRIRDTDIAEASATQTRNQILLSASTSVLSQANSTPQMALKLIG